MWWWWWRRRKNNRNVEVEERKQKKCGCGEVAMERNNRNVVVSKPF